MSPSNQGFLIDWFQSQSVNNRYAQPVRLSLVSMTEVIQILNQIELGDPSASEKLPFVSILGT